MKSPEAPSAFLFRLFTFSTIVIAFHWNGMINLGYAQQGSDGGKFDGALWTFHMTPHDKKLEKRSGMFRVNGMELFQKSDLSKPGFDKKVGQKTQIKAQRNKKGKIVGNEKTIIKFTDLQSDGGKHKGMHGTLEINKSKLGEWSGRFVDGDGLHWDFKCSRKQE